MTTPIRTARTIPTTAPVPRPEDDPASADSAVEDGCGTGVALLIVELVVMVLTEGVDKVELEVEEEMVEVVVVEVVERAEDVNCLAACTLVFINLMVWSQCRQTTNH